MGAKRCRLVLVVSPLQGHMTPLLQLATHLHSKGFLITIAHSEFNRPEPCNHPDFTFLPLCDHSSKVGLSVGVIKFLQILNNDCILRLKEHLVEMINTRKDKESIVIIYDNLMYFAGSVACELGLPFIIFRSCSAAFYPAYTIIPRLHQEGRFPAQDCLMQEIIHELPPFRYKDLPFMDKPIQQTLELIAMITPKTPPCAFIYNTLELLEQSALTRTHNHYKVPVFAIGPLHKITQTTHSTSFLKEDSTCISWLDKQKPKSVIYVSIGSLATMDEKTSTEMALGLVNSKQPFIWVVRPGCVRGCEWVEFLEEGLVNEMKGRGLIVKWAPQREVLAHFAVGGFWSHCGWNSTLESLSQGVPMLCQPFNTDQMLNARYLSYVWKMGVEIVVERGEIERAIKRVLVGREGEEMRIRAMEIQEKVKVAINYGGSSYNSLKDLVDFILSL